VEVLASQPQFVPVFLDDYGVLYADSQKHPELAQKFRIEALALTGTASTDYQAMEAGLRAKALVEAQKLLQVYPFGLVANAVVFKILMADDQPEQAAAHADVMMRHHPDYFMGYALKAQSAIAMGKFDESVAFGLKALARANSMDAESVKRNLYIAYVKLQDIPKAYEALKDVANPMALTTSAKDLYELGLAAASCGRGREGLLLLDMARAKATPENTDLIANIEKYRAKLSSDLAH
jgi:predicted Zn-dependent protease